MKTQFLIVFISVFAFAKGEKDPVKIFNQTSNGITTEYSFHVTSTDWLTANESCSNKGAKLFCYSSQICCDLPKEIYRSLKVLLNEIWLQRIDCSKPQTIGLYLRVGKNETGHGTFEQHFSSSKHLPYVCMRQLNATLTGPPPIQYPVHNASCPRVLRRKIEWYSSYGNVTVHRNCPGGRLGTAEWFCNKEGIWIPENPDLSDCFNLKVTSMYEQIGIHEVLDTITELNKLLQQIDDLYGGSLKMAVEILDTVDDVSRSRMAVLQPSEKRRHVLQISSAVVKSCDNILENTLSWNDLPEVERYETGNQFLTAVDETGILLVENILRSQKERFDGENIVLEVEKKSKGYFETRNLTFSNGVRENQTLAQLTLLAGFENNKMNETEVIFAWYSDLRHVLPHYGKGIVGGENLTLNTAVVSAHLTGVTGNSELRSGAVTVFEHIFKAENPVCVFWDGEKWSQKGCFLVKGESNETHTTCQCNHLTNFAVLMDVKCITCDANSSHKLALGIVSSIGCFISIFFLSICIFIFTWYRALWGIRTTIHRNLCISLLLAQVILLVGVERIENESVCTVVTALLHYFFLAVFFWMLLEGIQILLLLIQVFTSDYIRVYPYYLIGYGCPALIVGITVGVKSHELHGQHFCWLNVDNGTIWAFIGPVAVILLFNVITLAYALWMTNRITKSEKDGTHNLRVWVRGTAVLTPILGLTWAMGFWYLISDDMIIPYVFTVLNSIQGLGIFIFHCALNKKVQHLVHHSVRKHHTQSFNISRSRSSSSKGSRSSDRSKFWIRKPSVQKPSVLSDATPVTLVAIDPENEFPKTEAITEEEIEPTETTELKQDVKT